MDMLQKILNRRESQIDSIQWVKDKNRFSNPKNKNDNIYFKYVFQVVF